MSGASVLVVDDEPQIVRGLRVVLRTAGFDVRAAGTKSEALDALSVRPPDGDVRGDRALQRVFLDRSKSSFDFPGVSTVLEQRAAIAHLPETRLDDFAMDPQARAAYVEKFLSADDGHSSERLLDEIRRMKR